MAAKKKPAPKRGASRYQAPAKKPVPGWIWLVCGVVIGGFLVMLAKLEPGSGEVRREAAAPRSSAPAGKPQTQAQSQPNRPKYEFYHLLPESQVSTPQGGLPTPAPSTKPVTPEEAARIDRERAEAALAGQVPPPAPPVVAQAPSQPATTPAARSQYFLQAGSFRQSSDADRVRAQLLLLGQSARVESSKVNDQLWHRVLIGPFSDRAQLEQAQKELAGAGFGNLLPQQR